VSRLPQPVRKTWKLKITITGFTYDSFADFFAVKMELLAARKGSNPLHPYIFFASACSDGINCDKEQHAIGPRLPCSWSVQLL